MNRKEFIRSTSVFAGACFFSPQIFAKPSKVDPMSRIGMTTVVFRDRFEVESPNPLKLDEIPVYYKERFGITNIELWSKHFESIPKYSTTSLMRTWVYSLILEIIKRMLTGIAH